MHFDDAGVSMHYHHKLSPILYFDFFFFDNPIYEDPAT